MRVRMRRSVAGTFHGNVHGVQAGEIVDVDELTALRYCKSGIAERVADKDKPTKPDSEPKVEHATVSPKEERAVVDTEPEAKRARSKREPWSGDAPVTEIQPDPSIVKKPARD